MTHESFFETIEKYILKLSDQQKQLFISYHDVLVEWNQKINLISRNETDIWDRHFLNSAAIAFLQKFSKHSIIDIGSGGGFPAIILKILFPDSRFVLIESVQKKSGFLIEVIKTLKLQGVEVYTERAERIYNQKKFAHQFDFVTARAVASMKELVPMSRGFLKKDGEMLFLKGRTVQVELEELKQRNLPCEIFVQPLAEIEGLGPTHDGALVRVKISP